MSTSSNNTPVGATATASAATPAVDSIETIFCEFSI